MKKILSCEGCRYEIDTGCSLGLIEKLGTAEDQNGDISLTKICMYKNKDIDEIDIKMGYVFILNDLKYFDTLRSNIELIKDKNPIWIGISHNYDELSDLYRLDQFKKNYKNGWTLVNVVGEYFNPNAKSQVEKYIFKDFKSAGIIKDNKDPKDLSINNICFFNLIYKFLKGNDPEVDEVKEVVYYKSVFDKILEQNPEMFKTWEEIK
jgi:hypothetical protein